MFGNLTDDDADTVLKTTNKLTERDPTSDLLEAIIHGYGGMLSTGELVDRRKVPQARPIAGNKLLNVGSPKQVRP